MAIKAQDLLQRLLFEGEKEATASLNNIASAGERSFKSLDKSAAGLNTTFKGIDQTIKRTEAGAKSFGTNIDNVASRIAAAGTAIKSAALVTGIAAIGVAFKKLAGNAGDAADSIGDGAAQTGQSTKDYQELTYAINQTSRGLGNLDLVFNSLNDIISQAQAGGNATTKVFEDMGVRLVDGANRARSGTAVLRDFAKALERIPDPADRAAKVISVFGRRIGGPLVALLGEGEKGIDNFIKEAQRLGLVLTEQEVEIGDKYDKSLKKLNATLGTTTTKLGLLFTPQLTAGQDWIAEFIARNQEKILSFGRSVEKVVNELVLAFTGRSDQVQSTFIYAIGKIIEGIGLGIKNVVIPVFNGWIIILEKTFEWVNKIFGTNFSMSDLGLVAGVLIAVKAFTSLLSVLRLVTTALGLARVASLALSFTPWGIAITAIVIGLGLLIENLDKVDWQKFGKAALEVVQSIGKALSDFAKWIGDIWTDLEAKWDALVAKVAEWNKWAADELGKLPDLIRQKWDELWNWLGQKVQWAIEQYQKLIDKARAWLGMSKINREKTAEGGGGGGWARGGPVWGAGGSTSDSIPAWLSNGEWVMKARAARYYGNRIMGALNSMAIPRDNFQYAMGGAVGALAPRTARFAQGGLVALPRVGGRPINLTIEGQRFEGLTVPEDTAESLVRFATRRQMSSAGRKPNWYHGKK